MMRTLLGLFNGELGWEVAHCQGVFRKEAEKYAKTYVITHPGHGYLFSDFAAIVDTREELPKTSTIISWKKDFIYPNEVQKFRKYGNYKDYNNKYDNTILIHARQANISFKNYSDKFWGVVVEGLLNLGFDVACIGTKANYIAGYDFRDMSLEDLCDLMRSVKLVMGPSSGPIHLAQHCGTPVFAWGDNKTYARQTIKSRLESLWNPFGAPSRTVDAYGWQPKPEVLLAELKSFIKETFETKLYSVSLDNLEDKRIKDYYLSNNNTCTSDEPTSHIALLSNTKMFGGGERSALKLFEMIRAMGHTVKGFTLTPDSKITDKMKEHFSTDWRECTVKKQIFVMNDKIYKLQNEDLLDFMSVMGHASDIRFVVNFVNGGLSKKAWLYEYPVKKVVFLNSKKESDWKRDAHESNLGIPTAVLPPPVDIEEFLKYPRVFNTVPKSIGSHGGKHADDSTSIYNTIGMLNPSINFSFLPGNSALKNGLIPYRSIFMEKTSKVRNVILHLSNLDVYIYHLGPKSHTQGPRTVIEAMAMGLPVVTDSCKECGMVDRITHGVNGFLCDTKEDIIQAIHTLLNDHELRRTMGLNAREAAKNMVPEKWLNELL